MRQYENRENLGEVMFYDLLADGLREAGRLADKRVSVPAEGCALIAGKWQLLEETDQPSFNPLTHNARQIDPVAGKIVWQVFPHTTEQKAAVDDQVKEEGTTAAIDSFNDDLSPITSIYPDLETKLWDKLETEARAWDSDNTYTTTAIDLVIARSGEVKQTYVTSIIKKADAYIIAAFTALGDKRKAIIDLG